MKTRIISIILTVILVITMAVPVSAAYVTKEGVYDECAFNTYTRCDLYSYSAIMEFQYIINPASGMTWSDYRFKSDVTVYLLNAIGYPVLLGTNYGTSTTSVSSNAVNYAYEIHHIRADHFVNNSKVYRDTVSSPWNE